MGKDNSRSLTAVEEKIQQDGDEIISRINESEEETVNQMLQTYKDIKEDIEGSLNPFDVVDHLPHYAEWTGEKLVVDADKVDYNFGNTTSTVSLTQKKKKVLKKIVEEDYGDKEISEDGVASISYVQVTKAAFGFLIENPLLYEAFVQGRTRRKKDFVGRAEIAGDKSEFTRDTKSDAVETAEHLRQQGADSVCVLNRDGDGKEDVVEFKIGESQQEESQEESSDSDDIDERPLNGDEYKAIVGALYRDEQEQLASRVIDLVWGDEQ